jgi:alpha-tubulin suppressor-like RCC1 family protein
MIAAMRAVTVVRVLALLALTLTVEAQAPATPSVLKIVGHTHKLLLDGDGRVFGWGDFRDGQLGPSGGSQKLDAGFSLPVAIALPDTTIGIATAEATSYALLANGTVMAWGRRDAGQLGNGSSGSRDGSKPFQGGTATPVRVSSLTDVIQIAAGGESALALHKDGTVSAWGSRASGTIGDGKHPKRYGESGPPALLPVRVPGVSGVVQVSTSGAHVLALTRDGRVMTWGSNHYGALGRAPRQELPIDEAGEVPNLRDVMAVAAGSGVSTALNRDGTVWVWGANWHGQFGNGSRTDPPGMDSGYELLPQRVPGLATVTAIAVSVEGRHTLALLKDGSLRGWGNTDWGQIGAGISGQFQESPVTPRITGVRTIMAAGNHSFAVRTDGSVWGWGAGGRREWPLEVNTKLPVRLALTLPR